jgi:hypothetical protein
MGKSTLYFLFFFLAVDTYAQFGPVKSTDFVNQVWLGYTNQTRLSKHWGTWTDLHLRSGEDFVSDFSTAIIRPGITYFFTDNTRLTAGYAFVNHFPAGPQKISVPEHRPWLQLAWMTRYSKIRTTQWIRLEDRLRRKLASTSELGEGYQQNYRLRYNLLFNIPLQPAAFEPGGWAFVLNNEVHINFGKEIVVNYFDQNRFFAGFSYQLNKTDALQFGYLNVFSLTVEAGKYRSINGPRLFYLHNLDLRK